MPKYWDFAGSSLEFFSSTLSSNSRNGLTRDARLYRDYYSSKSNWRTTEDRNENAAIKDLRSEFVIKNLGRGSLAWFGRQTHNLEILGASPNDQKSRVRIPPPALHHNA